ncbi:MAG: ROK family protein, partial [Bacteroidales bacterium]|nr:ROK family protein [Bacteroidales bacterium]
EVNRDSLMVAVSNFSGRVTHLIEDIPFVLRNTEESVAALCALVQQQLAEAGVPEALIRGYGVSLTGRVNHRTGYSYSFFIGEEKPISRLLEEGFGQPVLVENDSRAMAYGEYMNSFRGTRGDILFLNIGWGLGMGMVLDGKLYYGKSGFSGEIGHFPLLNNNRVCQCGKVGCLETGASGSALHSIVLEKLKSGQSSLLSKAYAAGKDINLNDILDAVQREDVLCIESVEQVGATLGQAIAGLINIFNPDIVVIGGRLSVTEHYFMPPLRSAVNKLSLNLVNSDTVIKVARLGKSAGAVGASLLIKNKLLQEII